jgi:uncharacterized repeat protein (TIGR01451 family)
MRKRIATLISGIIHVLQAVRFIRLVDCADEHGARPRNLFIDPERAAPILFPVRPMSRITTRRTSTAAALVAACLSLSGGCASWQLPRIDPSGQRLFLWPGEVSPAVIAPPPAFGAPIVGTPIATAPPSGTTVINAPAAPVVIAAPPSPVPSIVVPPPGSSNLQAAPVYSDVPTAPLAPSAAPVISTFSNPFTPTVVGPPVAVGAVPVAAGGAAPIAQPLPPQGAIPLGQDHVRISPNRVMAPVGSEVVLKASICGGDGYLHADRRVEWLLSRDGAGQFVDVGERGEVDLFRWAWDTPRKVDNWYAIGATSYAPHCVHRGTPDPSDDVQVVRGEAWISVSSAVEGASHVTAIAPDVANWQFRQATATIYWIDAQWVFPPSATADPGRPHVLTTTVMRRSDGAPLAGWIVRYNVPSGGASLGYASGDHTDATTDANGRASVEVSPNDVGGGTATIGVTIIRPAAPGASAAQQLEVGRGVSTITWGSGASPTPISTRPQLQPTPIAPAPITPIPSMPSAGGASGTTPYTSPQTSPPAGAPRLEIRLSRPVPSTVAVGEFVSFELTVVNGGDGPARNILVYDRFDKGLSHEADIDKRNEIENKTLRDLGPGESAPLALTFKVEGAATLCHEVTVSADGAAPVRERGCVTVQQANIQVRLDAPLRRVVGEMAEFKITVQNVGSVPATNIELVQQFTNVLQAAPGSPEQTRNPDGSLRISIPSMNAGEVRSFLTQARCVSPSAQACSRANVLIGGNVTHYQDACLEILQQMP